MLKALASTAAATAAHTGTLRKLARATRENAIGGSTR
jgi:hypothetical protein